ncbi:hypothetical protein N7530_010681 [Penicillium desertorum]|uniref:Uncharacterized protein n=1 Tax=Penicillium desertorum TaxID=1303715 RepID=A0A9W9WI20_9EURO|nr:hypothetical protein N7530_010681 [Penicillium desertorum]
MARDRAGTLLRYLPSGTLLPRLYIYIPLSIILLILLVELFLFIIRNGVFLLRPYPYASIRYNRVGNTTESKDCTYKAPIYRGLTKTIYYRIALDSYTSLIVFVSGPYRVSKSVDYYECVLAIATDFGIVGIISYLKKLLYGYNTCTLYIHREVQILDTLVSYGAPRPDISNNNPINWDSWLTLEAL